MRTAYTYIIIMVTCGSKDEAAKIVRSLLKSHLIACANIVPGIESKFWWKGKIDTANEFLLLMKAGYSNFRRIQKVVEDIHSYEVPEIIAVPIVNGSKKYLGWLKEQTTG